MPEVLFKVRWPDGQLETCYSPSRVIRDFLEVRPYALSDFLAATRKGLQAASERVRLRYGGAGCSRALSQLAAIERRAQHIGASSPSSDHATVEVVDFIG